MVFWNRIALILTVIGGINWGLVGAFNFDLLQFLFSFAPIIITILQILVGLAACYTFYVYIQK